MHLIEITVCSRCVWHWLAVAVKKYPEPTKGHFPNSTDVTVKTKQNTSENWVDLTSCKPLIPLRWDHGSFASVNLGFRTTWNLTDVALIASSSSHTNTSLMNTRALDKALRKLFSSRSLGIYVLYNAPLFVVSNPYLIPFSLFHLVVYHWEKTANRNRAQMQSFRDKILGRTTARATWRTNVILV